MPFDGLSTDIQVLDVLHRMRDALSQPGGWGWGGARPGGDCLVISARRHGGQPLDDAVIRHLTDNLPWQLRLLWRLRRCRPQSDRVSLIAYNDDPRTVQSGVLALIDRTIASL